MGLSIRKSVKVGNLRVNLSKSGVGISTGVKGFRIGSGPRGNYISIGRKGVYYRKTISKKRRHSAPRHDVKIIDDNSDWREIDSAEVEEMEDTSAIELLEEVRQKIKIFAWSPLVLFTEICLLACCAWYSLNLWMASGLALAVYIWVRNVDRIRKTTVLFYDLDEENLNGYEALHQSFQSLMRADKVWHVYAEDAEKYMRGNSLTANVSRNQIQLSFSLTCNQNLDPSQVDD